MIRKPILGAVSCIVLWGCGTANQRSGDAPVSPPDYLVAIGAKDSIAAATAIKDGCARAADRTECYQANLVPLAARGSVRMAMGTLDALGRIDESVRRGGHVFAHAIGIAAGKRGGDISSSFKQCSETFQSGCYHGIIQAYFAGLDSIGATQANALCEPFRLNEADRWIRFQCVHGMGHGLTMLYAHDLPRGLAGCDLLTDGWDRHSCYSGAFMENIVNVQMPHHPASELGHNKSASDSVDDMAGMEGMEGMTKAASTFKPIDQTDPLYPCSVLPDRYSTACYEMQTSVMLYENHGDIAGAARNCDAAPAAMRTICYASLGRDVSSYSGQNHADAIRMCGLGTGKYQPWCYRGLVKNIIDLNAQSNDGMRMCRDVQSPGSKAECYAAVGEEIWVLAPTPDGRFKMCLTSEPAYLDACLYGARVKTTPPAFLVEVWKAAEQI